MTGKSTGSKSPLTCTSCGEETVKTNAWVSKNEAFTCPRCGAEMNLDEEKAKRAVVALDNLRRRIGEVKESLGVDAESHL